TFAERASYLEMVARQSGLNALADRFANLPLHRLFSVPWARWQATATHRVIGRHDGTVSSLAIGERLGRTVLVSGSFDHTVRVWDLELGGAVMEPLRGHEGEIMAVAAKNISNVNVIISGDSNGAVLIWDTNTGQLLRPGLQGLGRRVYCLAIEQLRSGHTIVA